MTLLLERLKHPVEEYYAAEMWLADLAIVPAQCAIITGSDGWGLQTQTEKIIEKLVTDEKVVMMLIGDRKGAERSAVRACESLGVRYLFYPTLWEQGANTGKQFNPIALHARNSLMLALEAPSLVSLCNDLEGKDQLKAFMTKAYAAGRKIVKFDAEMASVEYQNQSESTITRDMLITDAQLVYPDYPEGEDV